MIRRMDEPGAEIERAARLLFDSGGAPRPPAAGARTEAAALLLRAVRAWLATPDDDAKTAALLALTQALPAELPIDVARVLALLPSPLPSTVHETLARVLSRSERGTIAALRTSAPYWFDRIAAHVVPALDLTRNLALDAAPPSRRFRLRGETSVHPALTTNSAPQAATPRPQMHFALCGEQARGNTHGR